MARTVKPADTAQMAALVTAYANHVNARRRQTIIAIVVLVVGVLAAAWAAEVLSLIHI